MALWLIISVSDCKAVRNDTTRTAGCAAVLMCCWIGGIRVCVRLVRTVCKSLARVLTPIAWDLSLSLSLAMHAAMPFVCMLLPLSVCVWALLSAPPATADWPQVLLFVRVV